MRRGKEKNNAMKGRIGEKFRLEKAPVWWSSKSFRRRRLYHICGHPCNVWLFSLRFVFLDISQEFPLLPFVPVASSASCFSAPSHRAAPALQWAGAAPLPSNSTAQPSCPHPLHSSTQRTPAAVKHLVSQIFFCPSRFSFLDSPHCQHIVWW